MQFFHQPIHHYQCQKLRRCKAISITRAKLQISLFNVPWESEPKMRVTNKLTAHENRWIESQADLYDDKQADTDG